MPTTDQLQTQRYISKLISDAKSFFSGLVDRVYRVEVANPDTNLLKETAENTRKSASRLQKLVDKKIEVEAKFPDKLDIKFEPLKEVKITNLGEIKYPEQKKIDFSSLEAALNSLKSSFSAIYEYLPTLKPKDFPKIEIPSKVSIKEAQEIIKTYEKGTKIISDDLVALSKVIQEQETGGVMGKVEVTNFPPQHIPTPVTNINVNSLKGIPKSTAVTITTSATLLPPTALSQRRSMIIYNISANTIYLGGADVTTSNGFPVLSEGYSPPMDAGEYMKVYGIASSSSEIRVLELSNDSEGN